AEMNEIVRAIPLVHGRGLRAGMQFDFGQTTANRFKRSDVIRVRVRDEEMFELELVLVDEVKNRLRVESSVEQRRFAGDLVPHQIAVHFEACSGSRDGAQFTPEPPIAVLRQPAVRDAFELAAMQTNFRRERPKIGSPGGLTGLLQRGE